MSTIFNLMSNYFGKWSISNGMSNHRGKWNVSKLSLRCLSFIFSIIMIGFSTSPGANVTTPFDVVVPAWYLCLPLALYSTHLDISELMSVHMFKRNPGMPLYWYTVSELALLIADIIVLGFISTCLEHCDSDPKDCDDASYGTQILVFTSFFSITTLGLFTMACVDIHRYKAAKKIKRLLRENKSKLDDLEERAGLNRQNTTRANDGIVRLQELPTGPRSPQELDNESATPELEGSFKYPAQPSPIVREQPPIPNCPVRLLKLELGMDWHQDILTANEMPRDDSQRCHPRVG
ncbi:hypothetical protein F4825DRAFT_411074 [Nemania diffusa]|nr:hypothetical protein F4825DRAFT_411074 [Nemania diffusa]